MLHNSLEGRSALGSTDSKVCIEKYLALSFKSTLVTCWKQHGCDMVDFSGRRGAAGFLTFLLLAPGTDRLMFSGHEVSLSTCSHISCAAWSQSKLKPMILRWSEDKNMVWNACPATLYEDRLSIVSCHNLKQLPRSASKIWIRRLLRERVSPVSSSTTGIPVYWSIQDGSLDESLQYRLAKDPQTKTCKKRYKISRIIEITLELILTMVKYLKIVQFLDHLYWFHQLYSYINKSKRGTYWLSVGQIQIAGVTTNSTCGSEWTPFGEWSWYHRGVLVTMGNHIKPTASI